MLSESPAVYGLVVFAHADMRWRNSTHAFIENLRDLLARGSRIGVREHDTLELRNRQIELEYPLERCIITPRRNNNIFATVAETMWVLAGRNDIGFLSLYLPRAHDFSDDGSTWRAGYGPRIRNWRGVDQLAAIVRLLRENPNSRRAVISVFDPAQDFVESRDIPCNNWIHCYIRDGALHLNIAVRSNDIMWGFSGINTFEWSVIQEMLAYWTGVRVGTTTFFISSLHLYSRHERRAPEIVQHFPNVTCYETGIHSVPFGTQLSDFDQALRDWFALEALIREDPDQERAAVEAYPDSLFRHFLALLRVYAGARRWPSDVLNAELAALPETDLTLAAYEYFSRDTQGAVKPDFAKHPRLARYWDVFCGRVSPMEVDLPERLRAAISSLHTEKSAAYGNSWKRRGEILGIVANIARKVDRLERALTVNVTTLDESLLDTAIDLLVYTTKYVAFLADQDKDVARRVFGDCSSASPFSDGTKGFDELLSRMDFRRVLTSDTSVEDSIRDVLTRFAAVEACFGATIDERAASAQRLVDTALATVAAVVRASPTVARSTILSRHPRQDFAYETE